MGSTSETSLSSSIGAHSVKGFGARREKSAESRAARGKKPKPGSAEAALAAGGARVLDAVPVADVRRAGPKARRSRKVGSLEGLHSLLSSLSSAGLQTSQVRGDAGEARERSEAEMLHRGIEEHACVEGGGASSRRTQSSSSSDDENSRLWRERDGDGKGGGGGPRRYRSWGERGANSKRTRREGCKNCFESSRVRTSNV